MTSKQAITEKQVKERVKKILAVYGKYNEIYTFCPMTFGYGASGHPDRVIVINGCFIGVETKRDRNNHHCRPELKPKPNEAAQKIQAEKIRKAGGAWLCIHSENLLDLIDNLDTVADKPSKTFDKGDANQLNKLVAV